MIARALAVALVATAFSALAALAAEPVVRVTGERFAEPVEIDVVGLPRVEAETAANAAYAALVRAEGAISALGEAFLRAEGGAVAPDEATWPLLIRASAFCVWSDGVVGPLGGRLLRLWGVRFPAPGRPAPQDLATASESAACARLALDREQRTARLAAGSELDLMPFELGWAVDRASEELVAAGVTNFRVRVGPVVRGRGPGPDGKGWRVEFPPMPGTLEPLDGFFLRDRSAALLTAGDRPILLGGDPMPRWLDLRRGQSASGTLAVATVSELGLDAQALAWALFAMGPRAGQMAIGPLSPQPSALWALGSGESPPVLVVANWSAVPKR